MNIIYEIGEQKISEKELDEMCEEVIEVLKNKKITYAFAIAILNRTQEILKEKTEKIELQLFN